MFESSSSSSVVSRPLSPELTGSWAGLDGSTVSAAPPAGAEIRRLRPPQLIHPAYEFGPEGVVMRFRDEYLEENDVRERKLRIVAMKDRLHVDESGQRALLLEGRTWVIDTRYDYPPPLSREWSRDDLDECYRTRDVVEGKKLFADLLAAVHRHLDLDEHGAEVIFAAWAVLSFVYPALPAIPFLLFIGGKGSGKTQALELLKKLCRCGHKSRGTAAALGDLVASQRAVWLIDQANKLFGDLLQDLIDSYKAESKRTVTDSENRGKAHSFDTYGPKAFAAHKEFDDDLRDRCVQIAMSPSLREVEPILADDDKLDVLRWQLYRYAALRFQKFFAGRAYLQREAVGAELRLGGRAWELWWPFELVFEWLDVPDTDRTAARSFYRTQLPNVQAELDPVRAELLRVLLGMHDGQSDSFVAYSSELLQWLNNRLEGIEQVSASTIGTALRDLSLVLGSDRCTRHGRKVTSWQINAAKLRSLAMRYGILSE